MESRALIAEQQKRAGHSQVRQQVSEDAAASGKNAIFRVLDAIRLPSMGAQPAEGQLPVGGPDLKAGPSQLLQPPAGLPRRSRTLLLQSGALMQQWKPS